MTHDDAKRLYMQASRLTAQVKTLLEELRRHEEELDVLEYRLRPKPAAQRTKITLPKPVTATQDGEFKVSSDPKKRARQLARAKMKHAEMLANYTPDLDGKLRWYSSFIQHLEELELHAA